ncbi:hypothetical protein C8R43DRAFT_933050 [Mycena crocata]|nr:hypothetical protein C8R43DRAFT_933050 [Mycena crocata]
MSKLMLRCSWVPNRLNRWCVIIHSIGKHYTTEERRKRPKTGGIPLRIISTLKPTLLKTEDLMDLSRHKYVSIRFPDWVGKGSILAYHQKRIPSRYPRREATPFPPHCQGFLYYHPGICGAPLSGSLRFRLTASNNPASFPAGEDLLSPSGFPWQLSLPLLAKGVKLASIREQLLREQLATEAQLAQCRSIFKIGYTFPHYTLYHIDSVFLVRFAGSLNLNMVGQSLHSANFEHIFRIRVTGGTYYFPWSGTALARLEPSTDPKFAGRRVLHLRIVKIVQPVTCTVENYRGRIVQPREGELYTVSKYRGAPEPWVYDIDGNRKGKGITGLRELWDISGLP